ncbi:hypothetical protein R3P38DRAFT_3350635 [Favolaschia claudopus]|uniref:Uncharacterized protein n=1 Tax=Favolaschia claudopus TaxID=2862362 RepID=A0AAW0CDW6_9AGAR
MIDGVAPPPEFRAEDVSALQDMVKKYVDGTVTRTLTIASLSAHLVAACGKLSISYKPELIIPYLDQLDAHDAANRPRGPDEPEGGGGGGSGDPPDDDEGDDESGGRPKRRVDDNNYGDEERGGRKKVDTSKFAWHSEAQHFLDSIAITPEHKELWTALTSNVARPEPSAGLPTLLERNVHRDVEWYEEEEDNELLDYPDGQSYLPNHTLITGA